MWEKEYSLDRKEVWMTVNWIKEHAISKFLSSIFESVFANDCNFSLKWLSLDSETFVYMVKFSSFLCSETWDIPKAKCSYLPEHGPLSVEGNEGNQTKRARTWVSSHWQHITGVTPLMKVEFTLIYTALMREGSGLKCSGLAVFLLFSFLPSDSQEISLWGDKCLEECSN